MSNEPKHTATPNETIEEAAKRYKNLKLPDDLYDGFISGAKWQSEQNQSELESLRAENAELIEALRVIRAYNEGETHLEDVKAIRQIASKTLAKYEKP